MKKNITQDIIAPKKSIRNVEIPGRGKRIPSITSDVKPVMEIVRPKTKKAFTSDIKKPDIVEEKPVEKKTYKFEYEEASTGSGSNIRKYVIAGVAIFLLAFVVSSFFRSAVITVTPRQEIRVVNETLTAEKNIPAPGLGFQIVTTTKDVERTVRATGEERVDKKASGTIVIYNSTAESQKLVATTRFETTDGLIFRAKTPVTVPARQIKDGKTIAGSAEVVVEADVVGPKYNIGLSDFSVVGFKGTAKYTQIYARSKTTMTGGASGVQKIVGKTELDKADAEMIKELEESLSVDIVTQIPVNFVLYKNSLSYTYEPIAQSSGSTDSAILKKRATISAIIFDRTVLSRVILEKVLASAVNDVVRVSNLDSMSFELSTANFDPNSTTSITFNIKGDANFVWVFDENKLKSDLLGLSRGNAETIIASYSNLKSVDISLSPFWNRKIPKDPERVDLINTVE